MVDVTWYTVQILVMMVAMNQIIKREVLHYSQSISARKKLVDANVDTDEAQLMRM